MDLFNLYSKAILGELEVLLGFIIRQHNLNNARYTDDTMLISETEIKLQKFRDKLVKEGWKKGLAISCKKIEKLLAKGATQDLR